MITRKSHHYVPGFYLRNFATAEKPKHIGLYNYHNGIFIKEAPIKHQCCENFLYGIDDEIEAGLSKLETLTALTFQKIFESHTPPPEGTIYFTILKEFILYQLSRTVKAGKETNKLLSAGMKEVFRQSAYYKEEYKNIEFLHQEPTLFSLLMSSYAFPLMKYLSCKIIFNGSGTPFITSDNPAIKYNQFLESKKVTLGTTGIASKGLQLFLPIHPAILLLFYDPQVYKLKERSKTSLYTDCEKDVWQLNALQYINSDSQLFFGEGISKGYTERLHKDYKSIKPRTAPVSKTIKMGSIVHDEEKDVILNTKRETQIKLDLSFITLTKRAKHFELDNRLVYLRHPSFAQWRDPPELFGG